MNLRILLPFQSFLDIGGVSSIVVETRDGSLGVLPRRLDCVAALKPGILTYRAEGAGEAFVAVDEGMLIKVGGDVRVSVRRATGGARRGRGASRRRPGRRWRRRG